MMNGSRLAPIALAKPPIVDIISPSMINGAYTGVFSMFRLVQGYNGFCRRMRRSSDNANLDIGFTPGGLYDINTEIKWANGSTTYVERFYNQTSNVSPIPGAYMRTTPFQVGATGLIAGSPNMFGGHPAIKLTMEDIFTNNPIEASNTASVVWIGSVPSGNNKIFSISQAPLDVDNHGFIVGVTPIPSRDSGPFEWPTTANTAPYFNTGSISSANVPLLVAASYDLANLTITTNINGVAATPTQAVGNVATAPDTVFFGLAVIGGTFWITERANLTCHTFIVDSGLTIHNRLRDYGNKFNWLYAGVGGGGEETQPVDPPEEF